MKMLNWPVMKSDIQIKYSPTVGKVRIQSNPERPYSSAIEDRVEERHIFCNNTMLLQYSSAMKESAAEQQIVQLSHGRVVYCHISHLPIQRNL